MDLFDPLVLPNGARLPNRIAKAAMEENMADADQAPSPKLMRLYQAWADGGAGLLISGNVMIDGRAMTSPGQRRRARARADRLGEQAAGLAR